MVGVSTRKKGKKYPYYGCLTREREKKCDQEYIRADGLEAIVLGDVKTLLRDDDLSIRCGRKRTDAWPNRRRIWSGS
jgi:hypothetical protein